MNLLTQKHLFQVGISIFITTILIGMLLQPASSALITEFKLPVDVRPRNLIVDDSGRVWFTEEFGNKIGVKSGSTIYEFNVPTTGSHPWDLVWDEEEDELWFTEFNSGRIGRLKLGPARFVEFDLISTSGPSDPDPDPMGIALDKNETFTNVWFTEFSGNAIGKIYYNNTGSLKDRWVYTRYYLSGSDTGPMDIAVSPIYGTIFFTQFNSRMIGSFNPHTEVFKDYPIPLISSNDHPRELTVDSDGFVWFTLDMANTFTYDKIVKLNPWNSEFTFYDIPTLGSDPRGITVDEDNHVWFTEFEKSKIGRLEPSSRYITEFTLPNSNSNPVGIATSYDQETPIWFTEWTGNKIGKLDPNEGKTFSTVTTITYATTTQSNDSATVTASAASTHSSVLFSTSTTAPESPTATFSTATTTASTNRFATSSLYTNTETVFVKPTSTTTTTTSFIISSATEQTTSTGTFTSYISTTTTTDSITQSATSYIPVNTDTVYTTLSVAFHDYVSTTTITEFAVTSFRFKTVTAQFYTAFSTFTVLETTTLLSTITQTVTTFIMVTSGFPLLWGIAPLVFVWGVHKLRRKK